MRRSLFERAVALDPGFPAAWSGHGLEQRLMWGYVSDHPGGRVALESGIRAHGERSNWTRKMPKHR